MPNITILVCGGRNYGLTYNEQEYIFKILHNINERRGISKVVSGGANGADTVAEHWAMANKITSVVYEADWSHYGRAAGIRRNAEMLEEEDIDLVVSFPGGRGTSDMVHRALVKNIEVLRIEK